MRTFSLLSVVVWSLAQSLPAYAAPVDPAQAIAQKFSEASEEKKPPARPQAQRSFDRPGESYEQEMLIRAREEARERQALSNAAEIMRATAAEPVPKTPPVLAPATAAPPAGSDAPKMIAQPAIPREESRSAPVSAPEKLAALPPKASVDRPEGPGVIPVMERAPATILLVMDIAGNAVAGKPDPIICVESRCWISSGMIAPALGMTRTQAAALTTTASVSPVGCNGKSGCVFRNVLVDPTKRIEVLTLTGDGSRSLGAYTLAPDDSCRGDGNTLSCANGVTTQNYRIWIVPEAIASEAGAARLESAVAEGLPETDSVSANDK
jgi:hypothetical protein